MPASGTRLHALIEASLALNAELSLDALLQKVVDAAASLTDARYAALGVSDESGLGEKRFVTPGVDAGTFAASGDPPHGSGLLGVPILLRGVVYGNLSLTGKEGGRDFTAEDEEVVTLLAAQAAVAVENARLYESATRWSRQLETLHEVVRSLVEETELDTLLELICRRLRELIGARLALIALPSGDDELRIAAVDGHGETGHALAGDTLARSRSKSGGVLERRQSARVDSVFDDPEVDQDEARRMGARTGLYVPLVARGRAIGIVAVHDKQSGDARFSEADQRLAEIFAARAAVAVDLSQRVARDTVRRVVEAQELERRRLARELHDETGQALTSILLGLRSIRAAAGETEAEAAESALRELVVQALQDVRSLAVELRPTALDDFGLAAALERLASTFQERSGISTDVQSGLGDERLPPEVETVLYRLVQEALTNVVKHAAAEHVSIVLTYRDGRVSVLIEDDGTGFAPGDVREGSLGLLGMRERLALVDGTLEVESTPGSGTALLAHVPLS